MKFEILENFCPEWEKENISERFCEGCGHLDSSGICNYTYEEKLEIYETMQRLKIGL